MPSLAAPRRRSPLVALAALLLAACASCQSAGLALVKLMPGVTNDPRNRTMRRELMSFGTDQFCKELMKRGAPLKLRDDAPTMGRFFASQCNYQEMDDGDVFVQFSGSGYTWTQPSGRIGFKASSSIRYNPDFILADKTMYVYFRPRAVQSTKFDTVLIERTQQNPLGALFGANAQETANRLGNQIIAQELQKGFTVLRDDDGSVDFSSGIIEQGKRPFHPYQVKGSDKALLASDWAEIHEQQREFLGPFEIDSDDRALFLTMDLDGTPAVDVMVLHKIHGDAWLQTYINQAPVGQPPAAPILSDVLSIRQQWRRTIPLKKGLYYVVIDHTSAAGPVSPPPSQPGLLGTSDVAAVVRYVAQVGDAP